LKLEGLQKAMVALATGPDHFIDVATARGDAMGLICETYASEPMFHPGGVAKIDYQFPCQSLLLATVSP